MYIILVRFLSPVNTGRFLAGWGSGSIGKPTGFEAIPETCVFPLPMSVCSLTLAVFLLRRIVEWTAEVGFARSKVIYG